MAGPARLTRQRTVPAGIDLESRLGWFHQASASAECRGLRRGLPVSLPGGVGSAEFE